MARINIDDDVESQPEFRRLHKLLGYDDDKALGMLVRFWRLAQTCWGKGHLVPLAEIENRDLQPIIESRWGIVRPEGVYAIGSEERFGWYRQKVEAEVRSDLKPKEMIKDNSQKQGQRMTYQNPADHQRRSSEIQFRTSFFFLFLFLLPLLFL